MTERDRIVAAFHAVRQGQRPAGLTDTSLFRGEYCAQFTRQGVESGAGLPPGGWELYAEVGRLARETGRPRVAELYEQAGINLGLARPYAGPESLLPGDILFWPWRDAGHMATYLGLVDGVPSFIENTVTDRGKRVFPGSQWVRLTPLSQAEAPRTVIAPTSRARLEDRVADLKAQLGRPVPLSGMTGKRLFVDGRLLGVADAASEVGDKVYVRLRK